MSEEKIFWIGPRFSDIKGVPLFDGGVLILGESSDKFVSYSGDTRINHNANNPEVNRFFALEIEKIKNTYPRSTIRFMYYNPVNAYHNQASRMDNGYCLNPYPLLCNLHDKLHTRLWISNFCNCISVALLNRSDIKLPKLRNMYPGFNQFVVQTREASGGFGTYIFEESSDALLDAFHTEEKFLVSPYFDPSIPVNVHLVINKRSITFFPPSIQLLINRSGKLLYRGADFPAYLSIKKNIKETIKEEALKIGYELQKEGYLGVVGIDFIIYQEKVYFIEINPRFQASTPLLNDALQKNGHMTIQEQHLAAFNGESTNDDFDDLPVPLSAYSYLHGDAIASHIFDHSEDYLNIRIEKDGYNEKLSCEPDAYLFKLIFPYPISEIKDGRVFLHNNLNPQASERWDIGPAVEDSHIRIKIELLNQGISISPKAYHYLGENGKLRTATFSAVDLVVFDSIHVNSPYNCKQAIFSPYEIVLNMKNELALNRYGKYISSVRVDFEEGISQRLTKSGVRYHSIGEITKDRLRINHTSTCCFKASHSGCAFCNISLKGYEIVEEEIFQVFDDFLANEVFDHILIGGPSFTPAKEIDRICRIAEHIRSKTTKQIYVMCLPPKDITLVKKLYDIGVDEIAFNIEIFNREIAKKLMPGKGRIFIEQYLLALKAAVDLWGKNGQVKTMFVVGLEPFSDLFEGIETISGMGVQPMLSIFRPLESAVLCDRVSPTNQEILEVYYQAKEISEKYGQHLGPSCSQCQNNTLSLPFEKDTIRKE